MLRALEMPLSVHHLALLVADLDRAEAFYAGVLGLPVQQRHVDAAGRPRAVWLGLGAGAFLALERASVDDPAAESAGSAPAVSHAGPGWYCVALGIEAAERETWARALTAAGHPVERESDFTLYARDPEHNLVALSHHPTSVRTGGA